MTWQAVWRDDFNGSLLSASWIPAVGRRTADGELEYLTNRPENLRLDGHGYLSLRAWKESYQGAAYTSAMIALDSTLFHEKLGAYECRMRYPIVSGVQGSCWVVGTTGSWPDHGEIDGPDAVTRFPLECYVGVHASTLTGLPYSRLTQIALPGGLSAFHVYRTEIFGDHLEWLIDGAVVWTLRKTDLSPDQLWPFDQYELKPILSLFVGGNFAGPPALIDGVPAELLVDYVACERWVDAGPPPPSPSPSSSVSLTVSSPAPGAMVANPVSCAFAVHGVLVNPSVGSAHLHLQLDQGPVWHVYDLAPFRLPSLSAGSHYLAIDLVHSAANPLDPHPLWEGVPRYAIPFDVSVPPTAPPSLDPRTEAIKWLLASGCPAVAIPALVNP